MVLKEQHLWGFVTGQESRPFTPILPDDAPPEVLAAAMDAAHVATLDLLTRGRGNHLCTCLTLVEVPANQVQDASYHTT